MSSLLRGLLAAGGVGVLAAGLWLAGHGRQAPLPELASTTTREAAEPSGSMEAEANRLEPGEAPAPPVGSNLVPPAAGQSTALQRVAPRPPLSPPAREDPAPRPTLLHRPVALAAGRIEAGGHRIEIVGLRVTEPDRTCPKAGGGSWPCGAVARTAFRNWLRGRAVECAVAKKPSPEGIRVSCAIGKADLGAWLAEHGWAEGDGEGYAAATRAAREAGRGIFGGGPSAGG